MYHRRVELAVLMMMVMRLAPHFGVDRQLIERTDARNAPPDDVLYGHCVRYSPSVRCTIRSS